MQKITFVNNQMPALNAENLNQLQDNVENAINVKADTSSLSNVATTGNYNDLTNKPTIFSGNYNDLTNKPTIPTNSSFTLSGLSEKSYNNLTDKPALKTVATTGSYSDLTNKPTIPTVNNATLTIQKNGSNVATFTANASSNVIANISVPTLPTNTTGSNVVSRTSGATLNGSNYIKYANVVQLNIALTTSSSVNVGNDAFKGQISNTSLIPPLGATAVNYNGSTVLIGTINDAGEITVRVAGANIATSKGFAMRFVYIIN